MDTHHCCSEDCDLETNAVQNISFVVAVSTVKLPTGRVKITFKLLQCYEDALNLYETVESNRSQIETMLQAAIAHARRAMREVQIAEDQLLEADLQAGRHGLSSKKVDLQMFFDKRTALELKLLNQNVRLNPCI